MNWPIVSSDPEIQARYEAIRDKGESHMLADMLAHQQPPGSHSDTQFLAGHCNGNQFEKVPFVGEYYKKIAERNGVNVKGSVYKAGLARFPGDPEAWISSRADVKKICERRGWGARGAVNVTPRQVEKPAGGLSSSIINEKIEDYLESVPQGEKVDIEGLREKIIEKHAPPWAKKETE